MRENSPGTLQELIYPEVDQLTVDSAPLADEKRISPQLASFYLLIIKLQQLGYLASTKQLRPSDVLPIAPGVFDAFTIGVLGALKTALRKIGI